MANSKPDQGSAPDHELVNDDELLEEISSAPVSGDVFQASRTRPWDELAPRGAAVSVGEILADKYRIERVHARGALGVTCDAEHLPLQQRVVIKLCAAGPGGQAQAAARFLQSARLGAQLRSPHVARVLDIGTLDSGIAFTVTEHLSGTDLRGVLRVREWLPVSEAVDYLLQVCEGLAVAHVAGFVHRNLKLANVFLARETDGRPSVKVLDFCLVEGSLSDSSLALSTTESVVRSLAYLAPEQVRDPHSVDVRADIWALGALLHELLTGVPLHVASSVPGIFAAIAADRATPISQLRSEIPTELEEIVLRCLESQRDYRWSDVGTLAKQLRRFASEEGRAAVDRVTSILERRARTPRSLLPPALISTDAPRPVTRPVNAAPQLEPRPKRRLLEVGLAAMAIVGSSVGIGAYIAVHNLQTVLAARSVVTRPVVASLSPALPAAPPTAPAASVSARPVPVVPAAAQPAVPRRPATIAQVEPAVPPITAAASQQTAFTNPAASAQALFDNPY